MIKNTKDQIESVVWPRYKKSVESLAQLCWDMAKPKKGMVPLSPPGWFDEIFTIQSKNILVSIFCTDFSWIVFPEPITGLTAVVYKKNNNKNLQGKLSINLKYHSFDQFCGFSRLVEKTLSALILGLMKKTGLDIIELENEDINIFIFPTEKSNIYLKALGFKSEQIPSLISLVEVDGFLER